MKNKKRMTIPIVCLSLAALAGIVLISFMLYGKAQMEKIPAMSFADCLTYTLGGDSDGIITVGVIRDGEASYTVYGEGGKELPRELHTYKIGSLTKTFTAALVQKAVDEGKISLDNTLDKYLPLPGENSYPTISELLTHTSGYKGYYFEAPMTGNFLAGRNSFYGIGDSSVLERLGKLSVTDEKHDFEYSNFGYAALGLVLEKIYETEYSYLINRFAQDELGLIGTGLADGSEAFQNAWAWQAGDAYLAAGGLLSDIEDMLKYAQHQLDKTGLFAECHKVIKKINATTESNGRMGIRMDSAGMAWITDEENGIVWHNGGTGDYNCYLGFCPEGGTAVVILSNLAPSYRIPATVMGVKLLIEINETEKWQ